jgi:hypothetical protein
LTQENHPFERDGEENRMKAPASEELRRYLTRHKIAFEVQTESGGGGLASPDEKRQQFEAMKRWSSSGPETHRATPADLDRG